jgi:putative membrane protein
MIEDKQYHKLIIALSVAIPLAVAALFGVKIEGYNLSFLPPIYASINGLTAVLLFAALLAIKANMKKLHEQLMKTCISLSGLFLIMYVLYHMTSETTTYEGTLTTFYYGILISHILLSIAVIPLVLFTFVRALSQRFDKHKKLARITFPIWLYVALTGVIVYIMISPYYAH